jgi:hypothetical protein
MQKKPQGKCNQERGAVMSECLDPQIGQMIARYEFGLLSDAEKQSFENHLFMCDFCFCEIYDFTLPREIFLANKNEFRQTMESNVSIVKSLRSGMRLVLNSIANTIRALTLTKKMGRPLFVAQFAVVLLFIVFSMVKAPSNVSGMAEFEKILYSAPELKGISKETVFEKGMARYSEGDHWNAIRFLRQELSVHPFNTEASFYCGVSYLFRDSLCSAF